MLNVMLTGVGGQGTVLAAKVLAHNVAARSFPMCVWETMGKKCSRRSSPRKQLI